MIGSEVCMSQKPLEFITIMVKEEKCIAALLQINTRENKFYILK